MNRSKAGDRLRLLTVFIAVVDAGGLAAAARRLGVSPATVTRAIAELELQLGTRILTRTTRTIRLTEAGGRYAEDCRQILQRLGDAEAAVKGLHQVPQRHLTVGLPSSLGSQFVTPIVAEYLRRHPEAGATCVWLDRGVSNDGVDVALRVSAASGAGHQGIAVGRLRHVICASPGYLRQHPAPREPGDLQAHHIIGASWTGTHVEWQLKQPGGDGPARLLPRLVTNDPEATVRLVAEGVGLAQVPLALAHGMLATGVLVTVLDHHEPFPEVLSLQHRRGRGPNALSSAFIDLAVDSLRRQPGVSPLAQGIHDESTAGQSGTP